MIKEFHNRNGRIELVDNNQLFGNSNVFSILVGKNGTGKSTLLGNLITEVSKESIHRRKYDYSLRMNNDFFPQEIISISTSPFDKFPINRFNRTPHYTYLGIRDLRSENTGLAYLAKIIASLISSVSKDDRQSYEIGRVLDYLGYNDEIWMQFQLANSNRFLEEIAQLEDPFVIFESRNRTNIRRFNKSFFLNKDDTINERKVLKLKDVAHKVLNGIFYSSKFELMMNRNGLSIGHEESEDVLFLIQAGVVRLKDVQLRSNKDGSHFSIKNASSGEQSIILSILGIASKIKDNCLICIDEPEICLHPQWQEKYIDILTSTFDQYKNCHFIIATHSPQIISRLSRHNSFIVNMESNETRNAQNFINHSADFQLANIFDSPGYKNEYLSRIALNIFTKVSKHKSFDEDDLTKFKILDRQSPFLSENDPVYDLYITLKEMLEIYG